MISLEKLTTVKESAERQLHDLCKFILEELKPPAGPYALFNHQAHAIERLRDVYRTLRRLYEGRARLTEIEYEEDKIMPKSRPADKSFPQDMHRNLKQKDDLVEYMKQDLETLFLFGNILLDQWSILTAYIVGLKKPEEFSFHILVEKLESGEVKITKELWQRRAKEMLWLDYQLRFYRNKFIVHANRPWQRGTTRSVYGEDFNLYNPTPPGWLDDEDINKKIKELVNLVKGYFRNVGNDYWIKESPKSLIEYIFNHIGEVSKKEDREKVSGLYKKIGGLTPTFQIIGKNLLQFVDAGTQILFEIAKSNIDRNDLGKSDIKTI